MNTVDITRIMQCLPSTKLSFVQTFSAPGVSMCKTKPGILGGVAGPSPRSAVVVAGAGATQDGLMRTAGEWQPGSRTGNKSEEQVRETEQIQRASPSFHRLPVVRKLPSSRGTLGLANEIAADMQITEAQKW